MLYLLAIAIAATRFGRGPSLLASALSVLAYDYFFVPPFHTLAVADERHLLTFATMFSVSLLISALMTRLRRHEQQAIERERRTAALFSLSRALGSALDEEEVARVTARHCAETLGGGATVLLTSIDGPLVPTAQAGSSSQPPSGLPPTPEAPPARIPLHAGTELLGELALTSAFPAIDSEKRQLAEAFAAQAGLAIERARMTRAARTAELRAKTEEMRSSLLSAVSHDLRTPLAAITGAATTLRDASGDIDAEQRADLADTICVEAERLERLVGNLLEMTRLEAGALEVKREWVPLEEPIGSALARLEPQLAGRAIHVPLPLELPLVSVDPVLLEQVFYNLLDNALKYSPPGTGLEISARAADGKLIVELSDRGPGLPPGTEGLVFEKFFRGAPLGTRGAGLGLAICRGIVQAHGGTITAENRKGGGATFRLSLPLRGEAPLVPVEPEVSSEQTA